MNHVVEATLGGTRSLGTIRGLLARLGTSIVETIGATLVESSLDCQLLVGWEKPRPRRKPLRRTGRTLHVTECGLSLVAGCLLLFPTDWLLCLLLATVHLCHSSCLDR